MIVMVFQNKSFDGEWVGRVSSVQAFFRVFGFFLTLQRPLGRSEGVKRVEQRVFRLIRLSVFAKRLLDSIFQTVIKV